MGGVSTAAHARPSEAPAWGAPEAPEWYLEVEVSDVAGVHVGQAEEDLLQELDGLVLGQQLLLRDEVEQLTALDAAEGGDVRGHRPP